VNQLPSFDTPHLADVVEPLSPEQIDELPFGVIRLDPDGMVQIFNKTEAQFSGYKERPSLGRTFFTDVAPCMNNRYFKGRIDQARKAGTLDIAFDFIGDFSDSSRELSVRVQAAKDGGLWIFIQRPPET
jgi:photoactive yellow protein